MELLLLSNSTNHGEAFLAHAAAEIAAVAAGRPVLFVPYALADHDAYAARVRGALALEVTSAHEAADPARAIAEAGCVFVGGGNTFRLARTMRDLGVLGVLGARVRAGECAYVGSSAGTNLAAPTIRTTNDMPIVEVASFDALGLVPFQINPHYVDPDPVSTLMAETRAERIAQFHEISDVAVLGLFEGSWVRVRAQERRLGGTAGAVVFTRGGVERLAAGARLDHLWRPGRFDVDPPHA
jgi:dipeptidase E